MTVTVVTISYRDIAGLAKTIRSVLAQDHPQIQHVVIDGGSGVETERLLAAQTHLHHWQSAPDRGRYDAMNIGVEASDGDVVWFLHSGDVFHASSSVSTAMAVVETRASPYWGYGRARLVDTRGATQGLMGQPGFQVRRFALGGWAIPHQAAFFHRDLLDAIGPYDLDHGLAADQELMLRAGLAVSPVFVDEILCDFDTSGAGSTRGVHPHFADMRRAAETHLMLKGARLTAYRGASATVEARAHLAMLRRKMRHRGVG